MELIKPKRTLALALGVALACFGASHAHRVLLDGYGPVASEVVARCPRDSFYGEDFWMGVNLLEIKSVGTIGDCCAACNAAETCNKWTYCPSQETAGCEVPVGPLANKSFPGGACLLTNGQAGDNKTFLSWSYMQPGNKWSAGAYTPDGQEPQIFEDASKYKDNMEGIESRQDVFFCRKVVDSSGELKPKGSAAENMDAPPELSDGQEVTYTGLRVEDSEGEQWAVLFFNDSKSFWFYPADSLDYCDQLSPGCDCGVSGGKVEEGASCEESTDCCQGLFCTPRAVREVRVVYDAPDGKLRYEPFRLVPGPGFQRDDPRVLPNECVRLLNGTMPEPGNGPRFDNPTYKGVPLDFCRSFGINCGGPAADYFCNLHGYGRAVEWSDPRVPVTPPCEQCVATVVPEQGSACSTAFFPHCDTFTYIVCGN